MRFGSHQVPLRVMFAVITLAGLGAAATIPTTAEEAVDPIITDSISKVDTDEPSQTELPAELDSVSASGDVADVTPRQILPQSDDAVMMPPSSSQMAATEMLDHSDDPVVSPVMGDVQTNPIQDIADNPTGYELAGIQPIAGHAADTSGAIVLALDHARVMRMVGDVATIIIGNPSIADVSMPDPRTVVLTGKSYGETNMVMLDEVGNILAEQMLRVTVRGQSLVSVYRGVQRTTLSCSPTCEIRPTPGDAPDLRPSRTFGIPGPQYSGA